ncbi:hypothetical protein BGZ73_000951, partial [Actinomortierella ambigua]
MVQRKTKMRWPTLLLSTALVTALLPVPIWGQDDSANDGRQIRLAEDPSVNSDELSLTTVSPFCKSFSFLCHIRCKQHRGSGPTGAGNDIESSDTQQQGKKFSNHGELNRCSHEPIKDEIHILCVCNNGVDLTAKIDYALEEVL